jgi:hypothetical protein
MGELGNVTAGVCKEGRRRGLMFVIAVAMLDFFGAYVSLVFEVNGVLKVVDAKNVRL